MKSKLSIKKKIIYSLFFYIIFILFLTIILEIIFGSWIKKKDEWSSTERLNVIRNKKIEFKVDKLYNYKKKYITYTRDHFGLRGQCDSIKDIEIITLGGSTTDQRYINDGETWQDILQEKLSKKFNKRICISNAGVDGHSTFAHLESLKIWFPLIKELKPKIYILYIGINDAFFTFSPRPNYDINYDDNLLDKIKKKSAIYNLLKNFYYSVNKNRLTTHKKIKRNDITFSEILINNKTPEISEMNSLLFVERLKEIIKIIKNTNSKLICISQPHLYIDHALNRGFSNFYEYEKINFNSLDFHYSLIEINKKMEYLCQENAGTYYIDLTSKKFENSDFYDLGHNTPSGAEKIGLIIYEEFINKNIY